MSNNSVSFKVNDVGVSSFIEKIRQTSSQMNADNIKAAQEQTKAAKEQLKIVEEKIAQLDKQNKLETQASIEGLRKSRQSKINAASSAMDEKYYELEEQRKSGKISDAVYQRRSRELDKENLGIEEKVDKEISEQVDLLREQNRINSLIVNAMRENVQQVKTSGDEQKRAIQNGNDSLIDAIDDNSDPQRRLANQLASQQVKEERDKVKEKEGRSGSDNKEQWLAFAKALAFEKVGSMVSSIPAAENELDFIKPMTSMMGMITGGLLGNLIDAANIKILGNGLGNTNFGQLGQAFGEKMGEFAGSALERTYRGRDELTTSNFRLKALGGNNIGEVEAFLIQNGRKTDLAGRGVIEGLDQHLERFGLSLQEVSELQNNIAMRVGGMNNLSRNTEQVASLQGAWGVRNETSLAFLELLRSNNESDKNLSAVVGGILQKGQGTIFKDGDRTFLNEFLTRNYTQLQKALLSSQERVNSGTTMDILTKFSSMGGAFSAQDARSGGLINSIQSSLVNPNSDSMKALAFNVMRRNNPGMSLGDIGIEIQKGMGSPEYLQSMMKYITSMGGDESYQLYNVAGAFGLDNNLAAAQRLLKGYKSGKLGKGFSLEQLTGTGEFGDGAIQTLAQNQQGIITSTAEIQNAFIESAVDGIQTVGSKMKNLFGSMITELEEYIKTEIRKSIGTGGSDKVNWDNPVERNKALKKQGLDESMRPMSNSFMNRMI